MNSTLPPTPPTFPQPENSNQRMLARQAVNRIRFAASRDHVVVLPVDLAVALVKELERLRVVRQMAAKAMWKASWDEHPDYPQKSQENDDDFGGVFDPDLGGEG